MSVEGGSSWTSEGGEELGSVSAQSLFRDCRFLPEHDGSQGVPGWARQESGWLSDSARSPGLGA